MVTERWSAASTRPRATVPDVVAGLVPGAFAAAVAKAAVREALSRGARVRFLQVLVPGATQEDRDAADEATFGAALKALREAPKVPVTFESAQGDPGLVLVDRSRHASALVICCGEPDRMSPVAAYCLEHAACDVLTVRATGATRDASSVAGDT